MNRNIKHGLLFLTATSIFAPVSSVLASSTDVVLNLEGNPTCSSLGDNSAVIEYKSTDFIVGNNVTVLSTTTGGTQTLTYEIGDVEGTTGITSWSLDGVSQNDGNPINYIILKAQGNKTGSRVYHYGASTGNQGGEGSIADEILPSRGTSLNSVTFCYGLTQGITLPEIPEPVINLADAPLPSCDELTSNDLYTTQISCPVGGEEQLIVNLALNKANFGFDFGNAPQNNSGIRACTCNTSLPACNPDLAAQQVDSAGQYVDENGILLFLDTDGEYTTQNTGDIANSENTNLAVAKRSCLEFEEGDTNYSKVPSGVNERIPFSIQGVENPDSYICYTIGGTRYCYGHY